MYKRVSYEQMKRQETRRKRRVRIACVLFMAAAAAGASMALAVHVLAAPENPEAGAEENWKAELKNAAETISGNLAVPEGILFAKDIEKEPGVPVVVIDPGHGGEDEGCEKDGIQEKDINLAIAGMVKDKLDGMGYQAVLAREDDTYIAKEERVQNANAWGADLYVSIHQNAYEDESAEGIEVWYDGNAADGSSADGNAANSSSADGGAAGADNERLARLVHQETLKSTGAAARELREDSEFYVTRETSMPSCLIETGFLSNQGEREKLVTVEYQQQVADGIARGIDLYFHPKTMYLTFDDGPYRERTDKVLTVLKERNIKATFFLVGENVERDPDMARRIVEEGHTIGIHCYSHDYEKIYASVDSYIQDFEKAYEVIREATGVEAKLFRFPGGSVNAYNKHVCKDIAEKMTEMGFIYYDWNASLEDAVHDPDPKQLILNAKESTLGRQSVVMLAHDVICATGDCLDELLDELPEYEIKALDEQTEPVHFHIDGME